jgi:hypothetical protein
VPVTEYQLSRRDKIILGTTEILFDGDDISDAQAIETQEPIPNTLVSAPKKNPTGKGTASVQSEKPAFGQKKEQFKAWGTLIILITASAVAALVWFLLTLLK